MNGMLTPEGLDRFARRRDLRAVMPQGWQFVAFQFKEVDPTDYFHEKPELRSKAKYRQLNVFS